MRRSLTLRGLAKGAGAIVLGLVALDIVATLIAVAVGAEVLRR